MWYYLILYGLYVSRQGAMQGGVVIKWASKICELMWATHR